MLLKYYCPNKNCSNREIKPYLLNISPEGLYENEVGDRCCPLCKRTLMRYIRIGDIKSYSDAVKRDLISQLVKCVLFRVN